MKPYVTGVLSAVIMSGCSTSAPINVGPVERYLSTVPPLTHGEPPHRELQRYDYTCATGRYQLVFEQTMSPDRSRWSVTVKSVRANGRLMAARDVRKLEAALAGYADLSSVSVSCWPGGIQVFVEGRRQHSWAPLEMTLWISEGRLDRIDGPEDSR